MLILIILTVLLAEPNAIVAPPSIPLERGSIVVSDRRNPERWTAEWTMEPTREHGHPAVRFTETGHGEYAPYNQPVRWSLEAIWAADASFRPLRVQKTITDMNGKTISKESKRFDAAKGTVEFTREGASRESRDLHAPADTLTVEGIAGILRFLPFAHWHSVAFHFLSNEPRVYEMHAEMRGKERITTPAGSFDCYKIELVPSLGFLNVVRSFLPKARFWFLASEPHFWVQYEGPENGPGTP